MGNQQRFITILLAGITRGFEYCHDSRAPVVEMIKEFTKRIYKAGLFDRKNKMIAKEQIWMKHSNCRAFRLTESVPVSHQSGLF